MEFPRRGLLLLPLAGLAAAQAAIRGTWTARMGETVLMGAWTARRDAAGVDGWGTWTLTEPSGKLLAEGTWSARKVLDAWEGGWMAEVKSGISQSGSWKAETELPAEAHLIRFFESAIGAIQRGEFDAVGGKSGTWAIRAAEQ
ncbi:MAG: hypothetical protein IPM24_25310 [Bryobacterales bacterium]|nr:hypothetical protein [Bryobacterales bacterium]